MPTKVIELNTIPKSVDVGITQITSADLLQADVTIIAGVLVFLTISVIYEKGFRLKLWEEPLIWIPLMPVSFIISAGLLLVGSLDQTKPEYYEYAILAFVIGLVVVMFTTLIIIAIIIKNKRKIQKDSS